MLKYVIFAATICMGAVNFVATYEGREDEGVQLASLETDKPAVRKAARPGRARAYRDRQGHYTFDARMNGRSMKVLVDTGASSVAINRSHALKMGIHLSPSAFRHKANTANGTVNYARGTIREIRIDGITVRNVQAAILPDSSLDTVLLGMSFLNRLDRFEFKGRQLVLHR